MLMGIAQTRDMDSLEDVFKALDDDALRGAGAGPVRDAALLSFDQIFKPEAPHEVRVEAIKKLRQQMADNEKEAGTRDRVRARWENKSKGKNKFTKGGKAMHNKKRTRFHID